MVVFGAQMENPNTDDIIALTTRGIGSWQQNSYQHVLNLLQVNLNPPYSQRQNAYAF